MNIVVIAVPSHRIFMYTSRTAFDLLFSSSLFIILLGSLATVYTGNNNNSMSIRKDQKSIFRIYGFAKQPDFGVLGQ